MKLVCINCPRGCHLDVENNNGEIKVTGNFCPRGEKYALNEITNPTRVITSTVKVNNRTDTVVSVKTNIAVSKKMIFEFMNIINTLSVDAPCHIGDVVMKNVLGTGADIIITKEID